MDDTKSPKVGEVISRTLKLSADLNASTDVVQIRKRLSEIIGSKLDESTTACGNGILPIKLEGNETKFVVDYFNYYHTPRGFHKPLPNSKGSTVVDVAYCAKN